ncbi:MAG: malate/lactate/ureidoglycolate dehydrogenase [Gammaproteobacteria bacterium]|nr:malate/lactate/ureidoglycolate dehydrogenase [Gammaproteobacteria bacterium]
MLISAAKLTQFAADVFTAVGASETNARLVAEHLVEANLKGHDSHGVGMIPTYVNNILNKLLTPSASARIVRDKGAVLVVDGQQGFGQVVGREATALGIERARQMGVACVGSRNNHHLGRIGAYGEQCAAAGMVSVHFVNVVGHNPAVSPWGGREPRMTTNPFCVVVPRPGTWPIVLDMATSAVALGKVRVAYNKGVDVPDGALVDHEGVPTNSPKVMFEKPLGSLGPFGQHKGYGLAVMCELLGGGLAGEWTAQPEHPRGHNIVNHMFMVIVDPEAFGGLSAFRYEVDEMVKYLYSTTPAKGFDKVRIPGEPEQETMAARRADGIEIDTSSWQSIAKAAARVGINADQL